MSGVQPFQFEPTYPPGQEPIDLEEESESGDTNQRDARGRIGTEHRMLLLWRMRGNGNGGRVFLLPRTGGTESKVRWIRFVFVLGCFFSLDVYTKNTEKDIAVKTIIYYLFLSVRSWMYYGARQIQDCLPWYWRVKYCSSGNSQHTL